MEKGGPDYLREVPVLLWLYGQHRKAVFEREWRPEAMHLASPRRVILPSCRLGALDHRVSSSRR